MDPKLPAKIEALALDLARRAGRLQMRRFRTRLDIRFKRVTDPEPLHGNVLLMNVRVHGRSARHIGRKILNVVVGRNNNRSIRLDHTHIANVHLLAQRRVRERQDRHFLHARIRQDTDARCSLPRACAVLFLTDTHMHAVNNQRLF